MDLNVELRKAAEEGDTEEVKLLIQKGADVNAKSEKGQTALILAAEYGYTELTELLIQKGADIFYAFLHGNDDTRKTINKIAEEKPKLFTRFQRFVFELNFNPENVPLHMKKQIFKLLRELQKEGLITKEEASKFMRVDEFKKEWMEENFKTGMKKEWNTETCISSKKMRKPRKKPIKIK